jgi:hypothetical protein
VATAGEMLREVLDGQDALRAATAAELAEQTSGRCDNPAHAHNVAPFRVFFADYWLCPLDKVRLPGGGIGPVGSLTTAERDRINRGHRIAKRRRR